MASSVPVKFDDLLMAFDWVSASPDMVNQAFVSRVTGQVHWSSTFSDLEEELPDDIEDGSIYVPVPHKRDLNLGKKLAIAFAEERLPGSINAVREIFHKRGAYGRFKDLLERKGMLQAWYEYDTRETESALRAWAEEEGIVIAAAAMGAPEKNTGDSPAP